MPSPIRRTTTGRFVYGMTVHGLDAVPELSRRDEKDDAAVMVRVELLAGAPRATHPLDRNRSVESMGPAHQWVLDRRAATARLVGPPLDTDLLAHPGLGPVAIAFNRWAGRETFHAASFALGGRAYGVVGARTAGKSSLMAGLAARGLSVLCDDLLVTDGPNAYAGPRCIDLRAPIPGLDAATVSARLGTRLRMSLPPVPHSVPLGGWVFLHWGADASLERCPPDETLRRLAQWRGRRQLPTDPAMLLDIAALPAWHLTRPRSWAGFGPVNALLTETLGTLTGSPA